MDTLILSDLHIGSRHCDVALINEVLDRVRFDRLILNGDTINTVNFRKFTRAHWDLLDRLRRVARERSVILIRGNHDHDWDHHTAVDRTNFGTSCILPGILEVPMHEEFRLAIDGRNYLVLHGDRFDPTINYPKLTDVAVMCYQLTTKINKKLAKWLKKKSKRFGGLLEYVRARTIAYARQERLDGMITGHTHYAEDLYVDGVHYVNTGSWTEHPCAYATVVNNALALHYVAD
ncbi:MAG: metallophosphoesterase family protein [Gemmataceae bacterium]|nr:metallophosphoesterase family protein [Gemmataceae bacterium]